MSHDDPLSRRIRVIRGNGRIGNGASHPDLWTPWPSYPAIYFFVAHGGVLVARAVLTFGKLAAIREGAVWRAFGLLAAYAAAIGIFNAVLGTNYMYLCRKPANPSLLDLLGPWPVYLGGGAVVAWVLFWVLWLPLRHAARASEIVMEK